ncbi:MAG: amidohydrolase family protein [Porticoccaceae bacterium]|jgi:N-acyl-D-aspartate/D-glutamate deacylase|nr:amidohydrolase family protein [Porticoccaceae bacterium]HLS99030.1 amidohydrolase family protein [Porticoccaceae bacterium]
MEYDLKITGGLIIDGTGTPGFTGDIGIRNGVVVALGEASGGAARTIDASRQVVCPGFVDIHTHYDAQVLWDPLMSISPWHGVTTVVIGNCGFGVAPTRPEHRSLIMRTLEKVEGMSLDALQAGLGNDWPFESFAGYLDTLERSGLAINVAVLVGHTPVRLYVMGEDAVRREATQGEIEQMKTLVRDAMAAGALGFATSKGEAHNGFDGLPVPSRAASNEEIDQLTGAMAESGRGILEVTPSFMTTDFFLKELGEIATRHGCPVSWGALLGGIMGPKSHRDLLARTRELQANGARVVPQVSCRDFSLDFNFDEPYPFQSRDYFKPTMQTDLAGKKRIYADPAFRQTFRDDLREGVSHPFAGWYLRTEVSSNPLDPAMDNMPVTEAARRAGKDVIDFVLDLSLDTDLEARFRLAALNFEEEDVAELLDRADDDCVLGLSDAGAHASQLCDAGYATHLLGHWVRDRQLMPLERAIHILTQRPALLYGIADRGVLATGQPADVVVFDPATVRAGELRRVRDMPGGAERLVSDAFGIDTVIVNGRVLRSRGQDQLTATADSLPGALLRGGRAQPATHGRS